MKLIIIEGLTHVLSVVAHYLDEYEKDLNGDVLTRNEYESLSNQINKTITLINNRRKLYED